MLTLFCILNFHDNFQHVSVGIMMLDLSLAMLLRVLDGYIGCGHPNDGHQTRSLFQKTQASLGSVV